MPTSPSRVPRGLRYMAYAAFWFSVMSLLVKLAGQRLGSMQVVLVRAVLTLVLSWWLVRRARVPSIWGRRRGLLALRGLLGALALTAFYYSLVHLPLADATVIQYTNPVLAAVLAAWLLGERMAWREVALALTSLAGVILVARPAVLFGGATARLDLGLVAIALVGALCSAGAYVTVRALGRSEHPMVTVFYFPLITLPITIPVALDGWQWPTAAEWLVLLGVGVSTQAGQVYLTRGLQLETTGRATAVGYLQIVFAAAWGAVVFGELPTPWTMAGAVVVVGSTLLLVRGAGRR